MTETILNVGLLIFSIPIFFGLHRIHVESQKRYVHATDKLVAFGLVRERWQRELEIDSESFQRRLNAVRECEGSIYRYVPSSNYPEQLKAAVSSQQAQEHLDGLLRFNSQEQQQAKEKKQQLEHHLEEKKKNIQELNRKFRSVDRVLNISALVLRGALVLVVLYTLVSLLFGLIP